jgi:hypothetical protein
MRNKDLKFTLWAFSAAIFLFGLWVILLVGHYGFTYWVDTYPPHHAPTTVEWMEAVLENLQSEVWQVWLAALVFKWFRWYGTPESKPLEEPNEGSP